MGRYDKRKAAGLANLRGGSKKAKVEEPEVKPLGEPESSEMKHESTAIEHPNDSNSLDQTESIKSEEIPYDWGNAVQPPPNVAPDAGSSGSAGPSNIGLKVEEMVKGIMLSPDILGHMNFIEDNLTNGANRQLGDDLDGPVDEIYDSFEAPVLPPSKPPHNAPLPLDIAQTTLDSLNNVLRPPRKTGAGYKAPDLDEMTRRRLSAMAACLRLYCDPDLRWTFTWASEIAAISTGYEKSYGETIRHFIRLYIDTGDLPENPYGTWNTSALTNPELEAEIRLYLKTKGKYAKAEDIVTYLSSPEVQQQFGLAKAPCLKTAQRWMKDLGLRWTVDPKGQYVDGHERPDVVEYRNDKFVPVWSELERRMKFYDSKTMEELLPLLEPGEMIVMVWFHDESIFYANDRRRLFWVPMDETAKPYAKGEGASMMVADFVGIDGWLCGLNGESARIVLCPGKNRDGYMTGEKVQDQLKKAMEIAKARYPDVEHVFVYDNARTHTKRSEDAPSAVKMTLNPSNNVGDVVGTDEAGNKIRARMADTTLPDGTTQSFYFAGDHPKHPGYFKGIAQILNERGINTTGLKLQCPNFKCTPGATTCCARRTLFEQPDFTNQISALEELAKANGCQVLLLPKFHCELNPIEQCWGYAKRLYREMPPSKLESDLKVNMLKAVDSVPVESIRRFFNRSMRFIDGYRKGLNGPKAAWAIKKFRGHRMLPPEAVREVEEEFRKQSQHIVEDSTCE